MSSNCEARSDPAKRLTTGDLLNRRCGKAVAQLFTSRSCETRVTKRLMNTSLWQPLTLGGRFPNQQIENGRMDRPLKFDSSLNPRNPSHGGF